MKSLVLLALSLAFATDLSEVDRFLGGAQWAHLPKTQEISAQFTECSQMTKCAAPMPVTFYAQIKNDDRLEITTFIDKRATRRQQLTRNRYESAYGNMIKINLDSIASYGFKISISKITEDTFPIIWQNNRLEIPVLRVEAEAQNQNGARQTLTYLISRDIKGYGSLLYFEQKMLSPVALTRTTTVFQIQDI